MAADSAVQGTRIQQVSISPDGRYLAIVARRDGSALVMVKDRHSTTDAKVVYVPSARRHYLPRSCHWAKAARLVCSLSVYAPMGGVDRFLDLQMIALNADGSHLITLLDDSENRRAVFAHVVDWQPQHANEIIVANRWGYATPFYALDGPSYGAQLSRLNLDNNRVRTAGPRLPSGRFSKFAGDEQAGSTLAVGMEDSSSPREWVAAGRTSWSKSWLRLSRLAPHFKDLRFEPVSIIRGTPDAYMLMDHQGRTALWRIDLTNQRDPVLELWHEEFNVHDTLRDGDGGLIGVRLSTTAIGPIYLHPRARELDLALRARWPHRRSEFIDATENLREVIVRTWGEAEVPAYHVLSGNSPDLKLDFIGSAAPKMTGAMLTPTLPITMKTDAGRRVYAQLTLPASHNQRQPALVVLVSDWDEDLVVFDPLAQMLASRGYAVLRTQPASTSADQSQEFAPLVDWGGEVHSDTQSLIRFISSAHQVDVSRTCLIGAGFGGYVALLGNMRGEPRPVCVVGINAVTDVESALDRTGANRARKTILLPKATNSRIARPTNVWADLETARGATLLVSNILIGESMRLSTALARAKKSQKLVVTKAAGDAFTIEVNTAILNFLEEQLQSAIDVAE